MLKLYNNDLNDVNNNIRIGNYLFNKKDNKGIVYVPYYINYDPFKIEDSLITLQRKWRQKIITRKNMYIKSSNIGRWNDS